MKLLHSLRLATALALLIPAHTAFAETSPATETKPASTPWLYENSDVPVDQSWTFGVLDNGLRYAVKRNIVPAGQVSIRVRFDAGALHEEDNELGFAHLMEHLAFRGSEHVPEGEAKRIWQRFGVSFGSDSNAQTTPTQTVYKLDLPNSSPATLDESLKILAGMVLAIANQKLPDFLQRKTNIFQTLNLFQPLQRFRPVVLVIISDVTLTDRQQHAFFVITNGVT